MTEDLESPATLQQPAWKPRHRVEPRRPANPHPADDWQPPDMTDYLERNYHGQHRETTGPNLFVGLIVAVVCLAVSGFLAWLIVINYGVGQ